jgi:hypothetical protein
MIILSYFLMVLIVFLVKIIEEPGLYRKFGQQYQIYARNVPFFSFRLRCIRMLLQPHTTLSHSQRNHLELKLLIHVAKNSRIAIDRNAASFCGN